MFADGQGSDLKIKIFFYFQKLKEGLKKYYSNDLDPHSINADPNHWFFLFFIIFNDVHLTNNSLPIKTFKYK